MRPEKQELERGRPWSAGPLPNGARCWRFDFMFDAEDLTLQVFRALNRPRDP